MANDQQPDYEKRLTELGLELPEATPPAHSYVPTVLTGNQLWISGQVPKQGKAMYVFKYDHRNLYLCYFKACTQENWVQRSP